MPLEEARGNTALAARVPNSGGGDLVLRARSKEPSLRGTWVVCPTSFLYQSKCHQQVEGQLRGRGSYVGIGSYVGNCQSGLKRASVHYFREMSVQPEKRSTKLFVCLAKQSAPGLIPHRTRAQGSLYAAKCVGGGGGSTVQSLMHVARKGSSYCHRSSTAFPSPEDCPNDI